MNRCSDFDFRNLMFGPAALAIICWLQPCFARAFEGYIKATLTRGGETETFLYTVATNQLRIERGETDRPYARNVVNRETGAVTILFPHNRSFVHLRDLGPATSSVPVMPGMPMPPAGLPPGIGPQPFHRPDGSTSPTPLPPAEPLPPGGLPPGLTPMTAKPNEAVPAGAPPPGIGPTNLPDMPATPPVLKMPQMPPGVGPQSGPGSAAMPGMPMMPPMAMTPPMAMQPAELKATGQTTNLLGYTCTRYELKQRGELMEIWATEKLLPYQAWLPNQPHRFGPRMLEEQWPEMLKSKKLFPLLAILKFENGPERVRFEVNSIRTERIADHEGSLFEPPAGYQEVQPLPF